MEQGDATVDQPEPADIRPAPDLDTGDLIDPAAADPPPEPVEDPDDPSFVEPAHAAVRVNPDQLLPADPPYTTELPVTTHSYLVDVTVDEPDLPPVGTSLPAAPDLAPDPERDPEGHA